MGDIFDNLGKLWISYQGRKFSAEPYSFQKNKVVSEPFIFNVSYFLQGIYLNLHPTLYAVFIFSNGKRQRFDEGGVIMPFPPGVTTLHYIDRTVRQGDQIKVTENTKDAAKVTLAVIVTYRVSDPIKVFEIQQPVETLLSRVQADLKEYIRTHQYEDLISNGNFQVIDSELVAKYIKQQHENRYPLSKVFALIEVSVQEKEGDPVFIEKLKSLKSQVVDGETKIKIQDLNQKLATQEAEMQKIQNRYKADLDQQRAQSDMLIQKMRSEQDMELQRLRNDLQQAQDAWEQKQKKWLRSMEVIDSAVKSPYFREMEGAVSAVVNELKRSTGVDISSDIPESDPEEKTKAVTGNDENLDTVTERLRSLLDRKK